MPRRSAKGRGEEPSHTCRPWYRPCMCTLPLPKNDIVGQLADSRDEANYAVRSKTHCKLAVNSHYPELSVVVPRAFSAATAEIRNFWRTPG